VVTPGPPIPDTAGAWHSIDLDDVAARLDTCLRSGLSEREAARRLARYGPNQLEAARVVAPWRLLLGQLKNVLILILLAAVGLSVVLGHGTEALVITVIVLFAALLGFAQEYRAERAIEALRQMAAPTATVLRDGEEVDIPARELVPGDVMLLRAGDKASADGRLSEVVSLQAEESALTGESLPVEKQTGALTEGELPVGDRTNMVYAGTTITHGRGRAVVVATGMETEFGGIARMLQTIERAKTPLQLSLDRVAMILARAALAVVLVVVGLGLLRGDPFLDMLLFGTALAVAVVPEALPAVITISLTLAAQRMVKRNALGHLRRQDGHADQGPDDRPQGLRRRADAERLGCGVRAPRRVFARRLPRRASRSADRDAACRGPRVRRSHRGKRSR
jgi:Ca2+-transporting ATPase